jgi:hypothetical protein
MRGLYRITRKDGRVLRFVGGNTRREARLRAHHLAKDIVHGLALDLSAYEVTVERRLQSGQFDDRVTFRG